MNFFLHLLIITWFGLCTASQLNGQDSGLQLTDQFGPNCDNHCNTVFVEDRLSAVQDCQNTICPCLHCLLKNDYECLAHCNIFLPCIDQIDVDQIDVDQIDVDQIDFVCLGAIPIPEDDEIITRCESIEDKCKDESIRPGWVTVDHCLEDVCSCTDCLLDPVSQCDKHCIDEYGDCVDMDGSVIFACLFEDLPNGEMSQGSGDDENHSVLHRCHSFCNNSFETKPLMKRKCKTETCECLQCFEESVTCNESCDGYRACYSDKLLSEDEFIKCITDVISDSHVVKTTDMVDAPSCIDSCAAFGGPVVDCQNVFCPCLNCLTNASVTCDDAASCESFQSCVDDDFEVDHWCVVRIIRYFDEATTTTEGNDDTTTTEAIYSTCMRDLCPDIEIGFPSITDEDCDVLCQCAECLDREIECSVDLPCDAFHRCLDDYQDDVKAMECISDHLHDKANKSCATKCTERGFLEDQCQFFCGCWEHRPTCEPNNNCTEACEAPSMCFKDLFESDGTLSAEIKFGICLNDVVEKFFIDSDPTSATDTRVTNNEDDSTQLVSSFPIDDTASASQNHAFWFVESW